MKIEIEIGVEDEMEDKVDISKLPPALHKIEKYMAAKKPDAPVKGIKQMMHEAKLEDEDED